MLALTYVDGWLKTTGHSVVWDWPQYSPGWEMLRIWRTGVNMPFYEEKTHVCIMHIRYKHSSGMIVVIDNIWWYFFFAGSKDKNVQGMFRKWKVNKFVSNFRFSTKIYVFICCISVNMTRYILYSVSGMVHDRCYVIWSFAIHLKVSSGTWNPKWKALTDN